jgi:ribonuclease HI
MPNSKIKIYSDGSCRTNPGGVGGWGVVITGDTQAILSTMSGGEPKTTNSRMELVAVIKGLEVVHLYDLSEDVVVYSDSRYVIDNCTKFIGYPVDETDLWKRYFTLANLLNISHIWLSGHTGHPLQEIADTLATNASGDLKEWLEKKSRNRKRRFSFTRGKKSSTKQDSKPKLKKILGE